MTQGEAPDPTGPGSSPTEAQLERHRRYIEQAVASREESDWHDFKKGLFEDGEVDKLRKDVVALANTPGGPYQGFGYIIIGVTDDGVNTGLVGRDADMSRDDRVQQVKNRVQTGIEPYVDCEVLELQVEGKRLHVIAVPQGQGPWHLVRQPENQQGPWVRRGWSSERPTLQEYTAHQLRLVQQALMPVQQELDSLQLQVRVQKDHLSELRSKVNPAQLSARGQVRVLFSTPEHALLQAARLEISKYLEAQRRWWPLFNDLGVDHLVAHPVLQTDERLQQLREYVAGMEKAVQPLTALASAILHEAPPSEGVRAAVAELTSAVAESCTFDFPQVRLQHALKTYPGQLFMHGLALSAYHAVNWTVFFEVLWHRHRYARVNLTPGLLNLGLLLAQRSALDEVIALVEPYVNRTRASYQRMGRLLPELDWVGEHLPALHRGGTFAQAEVLLLFGYLSCTRRFQVRVSEHLNLQWWTYLDADRIATDAVETMLKRAEGFVGVTELRELAVMANELRPPGALLSRTLTGLVEERIDSWSGQV